jgi:hypothetical protein
MFRPNSAASKNRSARQKSRTCFKFLWDFAITWCTRITIFKHGKVAWNIFPSPEGPRFPHPPRRPQKQNFPNTQKKSKSGTQQMAVSQLFAIWERARSSHRIGVSMRESTAPPCARGAWKSVPASERFWASENEEESRGQKSVELLLAAAAVRAAHTLRPSQSLAYIRALALTHRRIAKWPAAATSAAAVQICRGSCVLDKCSSSFICMATQCGSCAVNVAHPV